MSWPRAEGPPASPDEASAGDDLRVAVVDGLAFEAQRVPLHAAVPCGAVHSEREGSKGSGGEGCSPGRGGHGLGSPDPPRSPLGGETCLLPRSPQGGETLAPRPGPRAQRRTRRTSRAPHGPVPRLTTTPRSSESFFMTMAARILRPSREGWKLLVRALKQRWLSMAIWSWKVLPVSGSCGDRAASGPRQGRRVLARAATVRGWQLGSQLHPDG